MNKLESKHMELMRNALLKCREEFCWHGNTEQRLNTKVYMELVDMIDAALEPQPESK